ncbi:MAG TPA: hypothetical protein DHV95_05165, partial [Faecalibacterium sp.]|nr:hypothetical protein [Faecalibacterium sp.]
FYQLKPIWEDSFFRLTDSVIAECRRADQRSLILRCKTGISRIDLDQLLYCEVLGRTAGHCAVPDKRHRAAGCHRAGRHPAAAASTGALEQKRFGLLAGLLGIAPREYLQFAPDAPVACPVQPSQPFRREPA